MLERGHAVAVADRAVRARVEQQPHDLDMGRAAVAEDHGLQQRGPAEPVDVVDVDLGLREDRPHVVDVPAVGGRDQRHAAVAVGRAEVGLPAQDLAQHRHRPGLAGHQQRVVAIGVLEVDVGARGDQHARDLDVIAERGRGHRRASVRRRSSTSAPSSSNERTAADVAARGGGHETGRGVAAAGHEREQQTAAQNDRGPLRRRPSEVKRQKRRGLRLGLVRRRDRRRVERPRVVDGRRLVLALLAPADAHRGRLLQVERLDDRRA